MHYHQRYSEKEFIGRGNYGKVYLVCDNKSQEERVAKKISLVGLSPEEVGRTMREIEIHQALVHENIIGFKEYFLESGILVIIIDYCEYGDLSLHPQTQRTPRTSRTSRGGTHHELVYTTRRGASLPPQQQDHPPRHQAPEHLHQRPGRSQTGRLRHFQGDGAHPGLRDEYGRYSLLPLPRSLQKRWLHRQIRRLVPRLCPIRTLRPEAFEGSNVLALANRITNDSVLAIPSQFPKQMQQLIDQLLCKDPLNRPSPKQILEKPYVRMYMESFSHSHQGGQSQEKPQQQKEIDHYDNEFMPNVEQDYQNQFLEDESFHPKERRGAGGRGMGSPQPNRVMQSEEMVASPGRRGEKLREKCLKKLREALFGQMYSLMRGLKSEGASEIEIEGQVRQKYKSKSQFEQAMDVAQLIYMEDNPQQYSSYSHHFRPLTNHHCLRYRVRGQNRPRLYVQRVSDPVLADWIKQSRYLTLTPSSPSSSPIAPMLTAWLSFLRMKIISLANTPLAAPGCREQVVIHDGLVLQVYPRQHQSLLPLLLLLLHNQTALQVAATRQDLLRLGPELIQLDIRFHSSHQQGNCLLILLQLHPQRVVLELHLLYLFQRTLAFALLLEGVVRPHQTAQDRFLIRQGAPPVVVGSKPVVALVQLQFVNS